MIRLTLLLALVLVPIASAVSPRQPVPQVITVPGTAPAGTLITSNGCYLPPQVRLVITAYSGPTELLVDTTDGCYFGVQWVSEAPGSYSITAYDANPKNKAKAFLVSTPYDVT